ncbi:hypothetical protein ACJBP0_11350, partial [Streptococcus suis]
IDELDLPEYTEEDALADVESEAAETETLEAQDEVTPAEVLAEEPEFEQPEQDIAAEIDELDLPEYTEEDALADVESEAIETETHEAQ